MMNDFFTPFKEIALQQHWSPEYLILNTLAGIYSTIKLLKDDVISEETTKKLETLFEIGKVDYNFGLSLGVAGANYGQQQRVTEQITILGLLELFQSVIDEIIKNTKKEVIIHYNNLELLPEKKLRYIFENLRDYFQTRGVHFIFVGNLTIFSFIQSIPRFASTLSDTPFHIESLTFNEVKEVLRKRIEAFRIIGDYNMIIPYSEDSLKVLHDLMEGNIRNILNSLAAAVIEVTTERPIRIDRNTLTLTLKSVLEKRYLHELNLKPREVLNEIVKHPEITNKALATKLSIERSNMSHYIKELQDRGCVYLRRKNGKDKFWSVEPFVRWSLLKESSQMTLNF